MVASEELKAEGGCPVSVKFVAEGVPNSVAVYVEPVVRFKTAVICCGACVASGVFVPKFVRGEECPDPDCTGLPAISRTRSKKGPLLPRWGTCRISGWSDLRGRVVSVISLPRGVMISALLSAVAVTIASIVVPTVNWVNSGGGFCMVPLSCVETVTGIDVGGVGCRT